MTIFLVLGAITSLAVLAAAAVSLVLLVQLLGQVVIASPDMENIDSQELNSVNFSRYDSGKTYVNLGKLMCFLCDNKHCKCKLYLAPIFLQLAWATLNAAYKPLKAHDKFLVSLNLILSYPECSHAELHGLSSLDFSAALKLYTFGLAFQLFLWPTYARLIALNREEIMLMRVWSDRRSTRGHFSNLYTGANCRNFARKLLQFLRKNKPNVPDFQYSKVFISSYQLSRRTARMPSIC